MGAGPSHLAFALLLDATGDRGAYCQGFKETVPRARTMYAVNVDWEGIAASAGHHSRRGCWRFCPPRPRIEGPALPQRRALVR